MDRILVIGYGNPMRGDAGIGWRTAEGLQSFYAHNSRVAVIKCDQLTPEMASDIAEANYVIFIDASERGVPGEIRDQAIDVGDPQNSFTHHLDPQTLLAMTCELFGRLPLAMIVTITGESFAHGREFSPAVQHALPLVQTHVRAMIDEQLAKLDLALTAHCGMAGT
jgi:hydrogenase maturation protease